MSNMKVVTDHCDEIVDLIAKLRRDNAVLVEALKGLIEMCRPNDGNPDGRNPILKAQAALEAAKKGCE